MNFKEIKPGMIIHCPKEEDARALLEKIGQDTENCFWNKYTEKTCYKIHKMPDESLRVSYESTDYFRNYNITEFSDLIEPDDSPINSDTDLPMTAAEVLEWFREHGNDDYFLAKLFNGDIGFYTIISHHTNDEIIRKITAYEAAKKAPKPVEVEWVDICRIIQMQDNGVKKCMYEEVLKPETPFDTDPDLKEQAEAILKKYISEHEGRYIAVMEGVCRVKGE